jgi:3-dehydroquinate dehydratase-1
MICVSISEDTVESCLEVLDGCSFAEIRMDRMSPSREDVERIFSSGKNLIATYRPGTIREEDRATFLLAAVEAGASYVDVELDSSEDLRKRVVEKARAKGCAVIVSHHDYDRTPGRETLIGTVSACFQAGADIAKVACNVRSERDNARLLGLLDSDQDVVVIGMGRKGRITRILAPLLGSPFTYAASARGKETAEGQIDAWTMKRYLEFLAENGVKGLY